MAAPAPAALPEPRRSPPAKRGRRPRASAEASTNGHATAPAPELGVRAAGRQAKLDQIEKFIESVGSATQTEIARRCNIPMGSMGSYLKDPRFRKTDDGDYRVD